MIENDLSFVKARTNIEQLDNATAIRGTHAMLCIVTS